MPPRHVGTICSRFRSQSCLRSYGFPIVRVHPYAERGNERDCASRLSSTPRCKSIMEDPYEPVRVQLPLTIVLHKLPEMLPGILSPGDSGTPRFRNQGIHHSPDDLSLPAVARRHLAFFAPKRSPLNSESNTR